MKKFKYLFKVALLSATIFTAGCNSERTPDYTHDENESDAPSGNRSTDSTLYNEAGKVSNGDSSTAHPQGDTLHAGDQNVHGQ